MPLTFELIWRFLHIYNTHTSIIISPDKYSIHINNCRRFINMKTNEKMCRIDHWTLNNVRLFYNFSDIFKYCFFNYNGFHSRFFFCVICRCCTRGYTIGTHSEVIKKYINSCKHKSILSASITQCHSTVVYKDHNVLIIILMWHLNMWSNWDINKFWPMFIDQNLPIFQYIEYQNYSWYLFIFTMNTIGPHTRMLALANELYIQRI
jgi:hypothetical protein